MKKILSLFLAVLLCFSLVGCEIGGNKQQKKFFNKNETSSKSDKKDAVNGEGPILYKVEKNGVTVYLFGSIHVGTDDMYPLPDYVLDAFDESDALAVEYDITDSSNMTPDVNTAMKMLYTDGTTISDHISEELYEKCVGIMEEKGDYTQMLDYYKPIMWENIISNYMYADYGYDSEKGVDVTLINSAKENDKEVIDIESMKFQFNLLSSFSEEIQIMLLQSTADGYGTEESREQLEQLVDLWIDGNEEDLVELLNDESGLTEKEKKLLKEYNNKLLYERNETMTEFVIEALSGDEDIFVCVGAAHIIGEGAIVDLLRQKGYTVTRV